MNKNVKLLVLVLFFCSTLPAMAQKVGKKNNKSNEVTVDSVTKNSNASDAKFEVTLDSLRKQVEGLKSEVKKLSSSNDSLKNSEKSYIAIIEKEAKEKTLLEQQNLVKSDSISNLIQINDSLRKIYIDQQKRMVNYAVNFVYLKFDQYTFDLANNCIKDLDAKQINANDLKIRVDIINNYKNDCSALLYWLESANKKMSEKFRNHNDAKEQIQALQCTDVYKRYKNDLWKGTYISTIIKEASDQLESFQNDSKINFKNIISELQNSLKE